MLTSRFQATLVKPWDLALGNIGFWLRSQGSVESIQERVASTANPGI